MNLSITADLEAIEFLRKLRADIDMARESAGGVPRPDCSVTVVGTARLHKVLAHLGASEALEVLGIAELIVKVRP